LFIAILPADVPSSDVLPSDGKTKKYTRSKKPCPECFKPVTDLPRHMRGTHKWKREEARKVTGNMGLRKQYVYQENVLDRKDTKKDYHARRACPIDGCTAIVERMSPHLTGGDHRIPKKSPALYMLLREA